MVIGTYDGIDQSKYICIHVYIYIVYIYIYTYRYSQLGKKMGERYSKRGPRQVSEKLDNMECYGVVRYVYRLVFFIFFVLRLLSGFITTAVAYIRFNVCIFVYVYRYINIIYIHVSFNRHSLKDIKSNTSSTYLCV